MRIESYGDLGEFPQFIEELIGRLSEQLNLNNLDLILFTENYGQDLEEIQIEKGLLVGYTNTENLTGVARSLTYIKNGETRFSLVFNASIILGMIASKQLNRAIHLLMHELVHVHDDNCKVYTNEDIKIRHFNDLANILRTFGDSIWSEFYADFMASRMVESQEQLDQTEKSVIQGTATMKEELANLIADYRSGHADIGFLFKRLQEITYLQLKITGNYIGQLQGCHQDLSPSFNDSYYKSTLDSLWCELSKLHNSYPTWRGVEDIEVLNSITLNLWKILGFDVQLINGELFIGGSYDIFT